MRQFDISELPLNGIKVVVFDLDGTLYDKRLLPFRLVVSDLKHCWMIASERNARRKLKGQYFGTPDAFYESLFAHIASHQNIPALYAKQWYFGEYMPLMVRVLEKHYKAGEFVVPLIGELHRRGIRVAVFSDYRCVEEKLRAIGLDPELFDYRIASPELGGLKPNKMLFEKVLRTVGVTADEALMIGDREDTDGAGARSVGMRYVRAK